MHWFIAISMAFIWSEGYKPGVKGLTLLFCGCGFLRTVARALLEIHVNS
jgi:hypothetical protein